MEYSSLEWELAILMRERNGNRKPDDPVKVIRLCPIENQNTTIHFMGSI